LQRYGCELNGIYIRGKRHIIQLLRRISLNGSVGIKKAGFAIGLLGGSKSTLLQTRTASSFSRCSSGRLGGSKDRSSCSPSGAGGSYSRIRMSALFTYGIGRAYSRLAAPEEDEAVEATNVMQMLNMVLRTGHHICCR
jgi:hypothetical protein